MQKYILDSLYELKAALDSDIRVKKLLKSEEEMVQDFNANELSKKYQKEAENYYELVNSKSHDKEELSQAQKQMHEIKLELDRNEKVKKYRENYIVVRDLYIQIDDIMLSKYRENPLKSGRKNK